MSGSDVGVAILGVGTIGGEVARRLSTGDPVILSSGARVSLVRAFGRGPEVAERARIDPKLIDTSGARVVETLGGEQPATDLMIRALASGKHVVTANKEAVSKNLPAILSAARDGGAAFLCEASVGGGIPLLVSLRQILATNRVAQVRGIVNGTTNFILHKMESEATEYQTALSEAQELGYAEPDPTADVEGFDAAYKIAILGSLISGRYVHPDQVERTGISNVSVSDIEQAKRDGGTIRLIAEATVANGDVRLRVAPTFVSNDELFSRVVANYNAVEIVGDAVGPVWLHGQGAGPAPTASAILSDIVEAVERGETASLRLL